jgi:hypothetical protein
MASDSRGPFLSEPPLTGRHPLTLNLHLKGTLHLKCMPSASSQLISMS